MGTTRARRVALAVAVAGVALQVPGQTLASPTSSVLDAARALAAVQTRVATLTTRIPEQRVLVRSVRTRLAAAQDAVAAATADVRSAHQVADAAAKKAQHATAAEQDATRRAAEAALHLKRLARELYINAGASELAVFVGFASDGPDALGAFTQRQIAMNNAGTDTVLVAQDTAAKAADASAMADAARAEYDQAAATQKAARDALAAAHGDRAAAQQDLTAAQHSLRADERALARAKARVADAVAAYEAAARVATGGDGPPISPGNQGPLVWSMLVAEGFSEQAAAGILGNLQQESGIDPTAQQSGGPGRGMAQWSQGGRWDNGPNSLLAFARARGLKPWNVVTQVRFIVYEMDYGIGGFDIDAYKQMTDVLAATIYFHDIYEASADSAAAVAAVRGGYAQRWYEALRGTGS